jgi:alkylation response protein AidB-like acyl-CoA dehydrogenase
LPVGCIYEGHINALYLIHLFSGAEKTERWFTQAVAQKVFGVRNTQDAGGIRLHDIGNGSYRLEGAKTFCSGANWLNYPLITN